MSLQTTIQLTVSPESTAEVQNENRSFVTFSGELNSAMIHVAA
jgi:hypothetical protein